MRHQWARLTMLRSYLRLVVFAFALLVGVQAPALISAYQQRVEAHALESEQGLSGFRQTAERFFAGDLNALVAHYRASNDAVMQSDAQSVSHLVARAALLERERQTMQGPWYQQAWHMLSAADRDLLDETLSAYQYQVLLTPQAIAWGLGCALLLAWIADVLVAMLALIGGGRRNQRTRARHWA